MRAPSIATFVAPVIAIFISAQIVTSCAHPSERKPTQALNKVPPIVFVHGIYDTHTKWSSTVLRVNQEGARKVLAVDYTPADGSLSIVELAAQVDKDIRDLLDETGAEKIDLVGFSLGTQVARYWIFRLGGKKLVRRFVAISGPFEGTQVARLGFGPVESELSPGSDFLNDLDGEVYAPIQVTTIRTPLDSVIIPSSSSIIKEAKKNISIPVGLHPLMYDDERVHDALVEALAAPEFP